ncbi:GntR family transcriptional regulator [Citricoccus sp.]|uniref:GntR family transcriptional regulator n=1 Tax=Citricoccus sp. TaxID=1978372 RepID=UPI0028BF440A|nr:GntR family transcriptional regulator [Citricoccus sp.]
MDAAQPIFRQLALRIEQGIVDGTYPEETQVPSTTEFSAFLRINPATANKGINLLVDAGILYKKRGIGMFVAPGARQQLLSSRREAFTRQYIHPLLTEAARLEITPEDLSGMIRRTAADLAPAADTTRSTL